MRTDPPVITATDDVLTLPAKLAEAMRTQPGRLVVVDVDDDDRFVARLDPVRLAKRVLRRRTTHVRRLDPDLSIKRPPEIQPGTYRVVNYAPRFLLLRSGGADEAADRAAFWGSIENYHEHQDPTEQDVSAIEFSRWFASDVIAPLAPRRVLEIGCAAGRNLVHIQEAIPDVEVAGVEINPAAAERARDVTGGEIIEGSLHDLPDIGAFDVVFSAGVLMHVPHNEVEQVVNAMAERAITAVVHFELHGEPHDFDFHRYPRDYGDIYRRSNLGEHTYRVLDRDDPLNAGESAGQMALLVCTR